MGTENGDMYNPMAAEKTPAHLFFQQLKADKISF